MKQRKVLYFQSKAFSTPDNFTRQLEDYRRCLTRCQYSNQKRQINGNSLKEIQRVKQNNLLFLSVPVSLHTSPYAFLKIKILNIYSLKLNASFLMKDHFTQESHLTALVETWFLMIIQHQQSSHSTLWPFIYTETTNRKSTHWGIGVVLSSRLVLEAFIVETIYIEY